MCSVNLDRSNDFQMSTASLTRFCNVDQITLFWPFDEFLWFWQDFTYSLVIIFLGISPLHLRWWSHFCWCPASVIPDRRLYLALQRFTLWQPCELGKCDFLKILASRRIPGQCSCLQQKFICLPFWINPSRRLSAGTCSTTNMPWAPALNQDHITTASFRTMVVINSKSQTCFPQMSVFKIPKVHNPQAACLCHHQWSIPVQLSCKEKENNLCHEIELQWTNHWKKWEKSKRWDNVSYSSTRMAKEWIRTLISSQI